MEDADLFTTTLPQPTANRPLLGLTVLVVEDSRFACEAMRLLCLRSGARIRRADCLRAAHRHLSVYRPSVIIVDLGLPDGSGADLIAELSQRVPRIPVILATSGDEFAENLALAAGADGFLCKPVSSLASFQTAVLSRMPADMQPVGLRRLPDEEVQPDQLAFQDDMAHAADILGDLADGKALDYVTQFVSGVARSAHDNALAEAAEELARSRAAGVPVAEHAARMAGLVQQRLQQRAAI